MSLSVSHDRGSEHESVRSRSFGEDERASTTRFDSGGGIERETRGSPFDTKNGTYSNSLAIERPCSPMSLMRTEGSVLAFSGSFPVALNGSRRVVTCSRVFVSVAPPPPSFTLTRFFLRSRSERAELLLGEVEFGDVSLELVKSQLSGQTAMV